jgi:hypothetical protein
MDQATKHTARMTRRDEQDGGNGFGPVLTVA